MQFGVVLIVSLGLMLTAFVEDSDAGPKKAILVNVHDQVLHAVNDFKIVYEFDVIIKAINSLISNSVTEAA